MPWRLFVMLYAAIGSMQAVERIQFARGAALGIALATDKDAWNGSAYRRQVTAAFPEES